MQVTDIKSEGLMREYSIKVGAAAINDAVESQLKSMSARVKIPGFRPGHIPMNVLKQRYGKTAIGEVVERQVNVNSQQVMKDKGLRPALPAKIEITNYEEGGDLEFSMKVEVLPDVPEIDFSKITLEKLVADVEEKDIKEGISRLAERNKKLERKGKGEKAKSGDVLLIDFVGKIDGVAFEGGTAKGARLEIDSKHFIPGFEEQLVGAKEGDEVLVKVSFPKDYHNAELAGKPATFDVTVHEISVPVMPALDDEFAKSVGFESFAKLEDAVRKQFDADYAQVARTRMKKQLFDYLEDNVRFSVPEGMLELEFNAIWERIQEAKKEGDEELAGKSEEELRTEYKRIAERRVRLGLILSDVGFKNKLVVTKEELSDALMKQARMFPGQEMKIYEFYQKNPQQLEELRGPILEEKAVDLVISKADVKEKKVSVGELMAPESAESESYSSSTKKKTTRKKAANE